jgi:hypothetical protein
MACDRDPWREREGGLSSFTPYAAAFGISGLNKRW